MVFRRAAIFTAHHRRRRSSYERALVWRHAPLRPPCSYSHAATPQNFETCSRCYSHRERPLRAVRAEQTGSLGVPRGVLLAALGIRRAWGMGMPRGDKSKYTEKQKRKAEHIEDSYESRGLPKEEAERRAWATVNKESGGGNSSGSGRGVPDTKTSSKRGGRIGGERSRARPAAQRSASAKKAAATRKRRQSVATKKASASRKRKANTSRAGATGTKRAKKTRVARASSKRTPRAERSSARRGGTSTRATTTNRRVKKAASGREAAAERQH